MTLVWPCESTDHGAECTYTPLHVTRTAYCAVILYPSGELSGIPMVRESITTVRSFSRAVKLPVGVGRLGLPIDAGIVRSTSPLRLTVKVCPERLGDPRNSAPGSKPLVRG